MNMRIITSVAVAAGLSLALSACDRPTEASPPLNCLANDGSAIPCPAGGGSAHTDPGAPEQQK